MKTRVQGNADILNSITKAADEEIAPQRASQTHLHPSARFVIEAAGTDEAKLAMVGIDAKRQLLAKNPRLDERREVILPFGAQLHPQPKLLPAADKGRRMKQIEVALAHFNETDNRIHRAEPGAHRQIASVLFVYADHKVLMIRHIRPLRPGIDLFEVLQPFQALLADFDLYHVEHFTRRNC